MAPATPVVSPDISCPAVHDLLAAINAVKTPRFRGVGSRRKKNAAMTKSEKNRAPLERSFCLRVF
jgi:hypothetical protein